MDRAAFRVAGFRFRATIGRRWSGYLALALIIGLVGGIAIGSIAAARRTQSSFPIYLASTRPPDLQGISSFVNGSSGTAALGYNPALLATIARLPHVKSVQSISGLNIIPLGRTGAPESPSAYPAQAAEFTGIDSPNSLLGLSVIQGRSADPNRADEFVASNTMARIFQLHIGEKVRFAAYTNAQTSSPDFGSAAIRPFRQFEAKLVGLVENSNAVVEDDVDRTNNDLLLNFTSSLTRPLLSCCGFYTGTSVQVAGGSRYVKAVQAEITRVLPAGLGPFQANASGAIEVKAESAIKPESIALGVFGGITALAALLIAAQLIGRLLRLGGEDLATLRALGADPAMTTSDGLIGIGSAIVIGALFALSVAVALSPLAPLGPARPVYPYPGVSFDWTVLGLAFLVLVIGLGGLAIVQANRTTPHRYKLNQSVSRRRESRVASASATAGLPPAAVMGVRFGLEQGAGRNSVPVRSAMLGATLAVVAVIATVTFGSSLNTLIAHPALYGWNWDYELAAGQGSNIPGSKAASLLDHDRQVAAWSGIDFYVMRIDGLNAVPAIGEMVNSHVAPPVLSGHGVEAPDQVVLGTSTLASLHKEVGDTVVVHPTATVARKLRIVGTATMPTIGVGGNQHTEMGTGALISDTIIPFSGLSGYSTLPGSAPGPAAILVRLKDGTDAAGRKSLQRIATATSTPANYGVSVLSVQRPAEIVNYRSMGSTPAILGSGLAVGAVAALALTLVASVRSRRLDLAVLKTLGFTRRQLSSVVAWQSSVAGAVGIVVGLPLGIVLGRTLWDLFAREISVVPAPSVPTTSVILIALGALALANLIAALPGRIAARTPTALLLRAG